MIRNRPVVTDDTLRYREQGHEQIVPVGTPAWYAWLRTASAFTFRASSGQFTARRERAGNGRGDWYWKAYCRRGGSSALPTWAKRSAFRWSGCRRWRRY